MIRPLPLVWWAVLQHNGQPVALFRAQADAERWRDGHLPAEGHVVEVQLRVAVEPLA